MALPKGKRPTVVQSRLNLRKARHLDACLDDAVDLRQDSFAGYKLRYNALPELALEEISLTTEFAGRPIAAPIVISCMTGGAGERFERINANLARAAERLNLPLGLGSMKVLLAQPEAAASFRLRAIAPQSILIANLGLVSFNYGLTLEDVDALIEAVRPDAFAVHLNALQEAIQPGGDTDFRDLLTRLGELVRHCSLPVYVKECGGGIAPALVRRLDELGVAYIDVSGNDGTSWAAVEGSLSPDPSLGELFKDFGLPTAWILGRLAEAPAPRARLVAGGGIRNGLQAVKALALGAHYVSVARPFFIAADSSEQAVVQVGLRMMHEMRTAMFLVGARDLHGLDRTLFVEPA